MSSVRGEGPLQSVLCASCIAAILGGTIFVPDLPYLLASDGDPVTTCMDACVDLTS